MNFTILSIILLVLILLVLFSINNCLPRCDTTFFGVSSCKKILYPWSKYIYFQPTKSLICEDCFKKYLDIISDLKLNEQILSNKLNKEEFPTEVNMIISTVVIKKEELALKLSQFESEGKKVLSLTESGDNYLVKISESTEKKKLILD